MARDGDWVHAPFQCEYCWFHILHNKPALPARVKDSSELALIRRANLDMFWSRAKSTVKGYGYRVKAIIREAVQWDRNVPLAPFHPWPVSDEQGMGIALTMLTRSLEPGRNANYTQFDTCRRDRSIASNIYTASSALCDEQNVLKSKKGEALHLHSDPMQSMFMERFTKGMSRRMPEDVDRNTPLMGSTLAVMLRRMKREMFEEDTSSDRRRELLVTGAYMAVTYGYSLRGNEGLWVCRDRLLENIEVGKEVEDGVPSHVAVPVIGFFKAEGGTRMHVFPIASKTRSGIEVRWWLEELVELLKEEGIKGCPAFCDKEGYQLRERDLEDVFQPVLEEMIAEGGNKKWWPKGIDVKTNCRCFRSFRRGAENTAINNEVSEEVIELVNRWRDFEKSRGKQPGFNMLHHYASGAATRKRQLQFSACI